MSIDGDAETITYKEVSDRISELEALDSTWNVVRVRTGELLKEGFADEDEALKYIDREDLNPDRISALMAELDGDDAQELKELIELDEKANYNFDGWRANDTTLYRFSYFDATWARSEAANALGCSTSDTYDWPFDVRNGINWNDAAAERRDSRYTMVLFDDIEYYAEDELCHPGTSTKMAAATRHPATRKPPPRASAPSTKMAATTRHPATRKHPPRTSAKRKKIK